MTNPSWESETDRFLNLPGDERWRWFARLLFALTMTARNTYTVGGDGLDQPERMRRFNELNHRVASQQRNYADDRAGMPDEVFLKMIGEEFSALEIDAERLTQMLR
jgi:hypothetical protein